MDIVLAYLSFTGFVLAVHVYGCVSIKGLRMHLQYLQEDGVILAN